MLSVRKPQGYFPFCFRRISTLPSASSRSSRQMRRAPNIFKSFTAAHAYVCLLKFIDDFFQGLEQMLKLLGTG